MGLLFVLFQGKEKVNLLSFIFHFPSALQQYTSSSFSSVLVAMRGWKEGREGHVQSIFNQN